MDPVQVDGVEGALGGADAAADAAVLVHDGGAAGQAAGRLLADLLLGQGAVVLAERVGRGLHAGILAGAVVIGLDQDVVLVQLDEIAPVAADGHVPMLHEAVQGLGGLLAGGDGVDGELRAGVHVAAHEDVGLRRLVGELVGHGVHAAEELHLRILEQVLQHHGLADGEDDLVGLEGNELILIIFRGEPLVLVEHGGALLEHDAGDLAVAEDLLRAPARVDHDAVLAGLGALLQGGGHDVLGLERQHRHLGRAAALRYAGRVDRDIAAAHDDHLAGHLHLAGVRRVEEVDGRGRAGERLARDAGQLAALAADGHVEALVALLAQAGDRDVLADLHAALDVDADLLHDVDLGLDDVLLQLIGRDAVAEHAAGLLVLLEHRRLVAHGGEVVGAAQAGRAAADDGDLLLPAVLDVGADVHLGDEARLRVQVLLRDELLHRVDGDGLVDGAAGAGVLAAAVAHAPADGRERILPLDELQRLGVLALGGLLQVALDGDVRRAGGLAGRRAGVVAVDPVLVSVVLGPLVRAPLGRIRQFLLGIGLRTVLGAQLLAQLHRAGGAVFHAAAAGDAVLRVHLGHVGAPGHVGRIEQLRRAERVADLDVAVADGEDLPFAVDVRHLVHEAVVLRLLEDGDRLVVGDEVAAAGLGQVFGHVAHADAPVAVVVGAALVQLLPAVSAGADAHGEVPLIPLEPVGDVLDVDGLVLHRDGLLHRDDVHADAGAAHGHHRRDLLQREEGHPLEEHRQLRMLVHELDVHVGVLGRSRDEHRHPVDAVLPVETGAGHGAFLRVLVAVVILQHAEVGELVQQFVEGLVVRGVMLLRIHLMQFRIGVVLAHAEEVPGQHVQQEIQRGLPGHGVHLVLEDAREAPVLGGVGVHLDLSGDAVRDVADEFQELGIGILIPFVLGDKLLGHLRHKYRLLALFPGFYLGEQPVGKVVEPLARLGADGNDAGLGIAHADIFAALVQVEVEVRHHIDLVHQDEVADREHERVFQGLVVPFRDGEDHGVAHGAGVELGRAHEVAHILQDDEIHLREGHVVQPLARHFGVQVAHPARVELDGGDARGLLDLDGIDIAVDVRLHHGHAHLVLDALERTDERGGLSRAGRGHQIQEVNSLAFQFFSEFVGVLVVVREDTLLDLDDFYIIHGGSGYRFVSVVQYANIRIKPRLSKTTALRGPASPCNGRSPARGREP